MLEATGTLSGNFSWENTKNCRNILDVYEVTLKFQKILNPRMWIQWHFRSSLHSNFFGAPDNSPWPLSHRSLSSRFPNFPGTQSAVPPDCHLLLQEGGCIRDGVTQNQGRNWRKRGFRIRLSLNRKWGRKERGIWKIRLETVAETDNDLPHPTALEVSRRHSSSLQCTHFQLVAFTTFGRPEVFQVIWVLF